MNIRHSKSGFTTLFAALAFASASLAGAAESGLSHNEQAAQNAIASVSSVSITTSAPDAGAATLAQNEKAAQRVFVVDYATVPSPIAAGNEPVALVSNERAAQRAIVDVPRAKPAITSAVATTPVAVR